MKPIALLALLTLPSTVAVAQRVEIAPFVGRYQPLPGTWNGVGFDLDINCPPVDCGDLTYLSQVRRHSAGAVGARLGVQLSARAGIEAVVWRARQATELSFRNPEVFPQPEDQLEHVTTIVAAVRPVFRLPLQDFLELRVSGGPAIAVVDAQHSHSRYRATRAGTQVAFDLASALRIHVASGLAIELSAGDTWTFASGGAAGALHHFMYGVGLAVGVPN